MRLMANLKSYLAETGTKQSALARQIGITAGYMSALVSEGAQPSLEVAVRIERATCGAVPAASWIPEAEASVATLPPSEDAA